MMFVYVEVVENECGCSERARKGWEGVACRLSFAQRVLGVNVYLDLKLRDSEATLLFFFSCFLFNVVALY